MREKDLITKTKRKLIGLDENDETGKLSVKQQVINNREVRSIDHTTSVHSLSLLRSNYHCIEYEKVDNLLHKHQDLPYNDPRAQLNLRYCHPDEVNKIRNKQLIFKEKYYLKHFILSKNGKNLNLMEQILKYIDNNIDTLYKYGMDKKGLYKSISKGKSATEIRVVNYKEKMKKWRTQWNKKK